MSRSPAAVFHSVLCSQPLEVVQNSDLVFLGMKSNSHNRDKDMFGNAFIYFGNAFNAFICEYFLHAYSFHNVRRIHNACFLHFTCISVAVTLVMLCFSSQM